MSDMERLHGDEEAIETGSLRFYEVLRPHFSMKTGALDLATPREEITRTTHNLLAEGYDEADINNAFTDAIWTLNDMKQIADYL